MPMSADGPEDTDLEQVAQPVSVGSQCAVLCCRRQLIHHLCNRINLGVYVHVCVSVAVCEVVYGRCGVVDRRNVVECVYV